MRSPLGRLLAALVLLVVLDLARCQWGEAVRPWQWLAILLALVALGSFLASRGVRGRDALPVLALAVFLVPTYLDHSRKLESDGFHYYTFLRSVLFDHDLDLTNDYAILGTDYRAPNAQSVGCAILWSPLVLAVHGVSEAARLFGAPAPDGTEPLYQGAACLGSLVYGFAGLFLLLGLLRRVFGASAAFWTTVVCWVGTPLRFYLSVLPSLAHAPEFFAGVTVLWGYLALRERPDTRTAVLAGAAGGLAFLVRAQDGILGWLVGFELLLRWLESRSRARFRPLVGVVAGFAVVALPQLVAWQIMFGVPFLIPHELLHGTAFLHLQHPQLAGTLISPRGGLFASYPATLLAAVGLLGLAFRRRRRGLVAPVDLDARYVLAVAPVVVAGWYVNSTIFDWYQVRRFTGVVPLLAPGLALLWRPLTRAGVIASALVAFLFLRYDYAVDHLRTEPGRPVPVRAALDEVGDGLARDGYALLEPRMPHAAVALLGAYTGESYLGEEVSEVDLSGSPALLHLPEPARHLSAPSVEQGVLCRWVTSEDTRFFLPVPRAGGVILTIRARALETFQPQAMEAVWNGHSAGRAPMIPSWTEYRFHVPAEAVHAGTNVLVLRFDRTPIYRRIRGKGPRQVRPAALAWLRFNRED